MNLILISLQWKIESKIVKEFISKMLFREHEKWWIWKKKKIVQRRIFEVPKQFSTIIMIRRIDHREMSECLTGDIIARDIDSNASVRPRQETCDMP